MHRLRATTLRSVLTHLRPMRNFTRLHATLVAGLAKPLARSRESRASLASLCVPLTCACTRRRSHAARAHTFIRVVHGVVPLWLCCQACVSCTCVVRYVLRGSVLSCLCAIRRETLVPA